jgi:endoglucanase
MMLALLLGACNPVPPAAPTPSRASATPANTPVPTATAPPVATSTSTPTPSATAVPSEDGSANLGRGVNLGNALEAPNEGEWGVTLEVADFELIKSAGFDSVRIPIRWSGHAMEATPYTIDAAFFERVDWAIKQALSRSLTAVINMHHYEELMQSPDQHRERFVALWRQIADHYKDYPDKLYFELLNEPHDISATAWNKLLAETLTEIRATNPDRYIVVGPLDWNSHRRLSDLALPANDRRLIVTFHYYLPFEFTHQGAEWVDGADKWLGTTWEGTRMQRDSIDFDLNIAAQWGKANNRPIFMGEFGAYSKADIDSRARWTSYVARQAEAHGLGWAYWEFRAGFGVYNGQTKRWNEPILTALVPER